MSDNGVIVINSSERVSFTMSQIIKPFVIVSKPVPLNGKDFDIYWWDHYNHDILIEMVDI